MCIVALHTWPCHVHRAHDLKLSEYNREKGNCQSMRLQHVQNGTTISFFFKFTSAAIRRSLHSLRTWAWPCESACAAPCHWMLSHASYLWLMTETKRESADKSSTTTLQQHQFSHVNMILFTPCASFFPSAIGWQASALFTTARFYIWESYQLCLDFLWQVLLQRPNIFPFQSQLRPILKLNL